MTVVATGGGLKYQWYKNATPIPSATSSAYHRRPCGPVPTRAITRYLSRMRWAPSPVVLRSSSRFPAWPRAATKPRSSTPRPKPGGASTNRPGSTNMFDGMGRHDGVYTNASGAGPLPTLGATGALVDNPNTAASFAASGQGLGLVPYSPDLNAPQLRHRGLGEHDASPTARFRSPAATAPGDGGFSRLADGGTGTAAKVSSGITSSSIPKRPLFPDSGAMW